MEKLTKDTTLFEKLWQFKMHQIKVDINPRSFLIYRTNFISFLIDKKVLISSFRTLKMNSCYGLLSMGKN